MTEVERLIENGVEVYPENLGGDCCGDESCQCGGCPMYEASKNRMKKMLEEMDAEKDNR